MLEAFTKAAEGAVDDIALWRLERGSDGIVLNQFEGKTLKAGIE